MIQFTKVGLSKECDLQQVWSVLLEKLSVQLEDFLDKK